MELPEKVTSINAVSPSDSTSRNISEETQNTGLKEHKHPYVYCSIIHNTARFGSHPSGQSVDKWIKKQWYIYKMEYYSDVKKKEILPFVTAWMDLES